MSKFGKLSVMAAAIVASIAAIAVAGTFTASATELCPENISACPNPDKAGTAIEATTSLMTLTTNSGSITCTHSVIKGQTTTIGGKSPTNVEASIESVTATGTGAKGECTLDTPFGKSDPCTVTANNLPWKGVISKSAQPSGTLTLSSSGKGEPGFTVTCPALNVVCIYHATSIVLDWDGGEPAVLTAIKEPFEETPEGANACTVSPSWDGTYTILKPTAGYLVN
jgi:hypothetical protein